MHRLVLPVAMLLSFAAAWITFRWTHKEPLFKPRAPETTVRPVAEFEPTFGIGLSAELLFKPHGLALMKAILTTGAKVYVFVPGNRREEVDKFIRTTKQLSGVERESIVKIQLEHESIWARDYFPIPVLKLIPHLAPTPSFVDFVYRDGNTLDDAAIHQFALAINLSLEHLPIVLDGGNFMTNGETCVLTQDISEDPEILLLNSPEPPLESNLGDIFRAAIGCKKTILVSQVPHPHVDMWMKFVNKTTLVVNRLDQAAIDLNPALGDYEKDKAKRIAAALDQAAEVLAKDFQIVRMPMLAPLGDAYMTYTNAVISNGQVIVPKYSKGGKNETSAYSRLIVSYEQEVESTYKRFGYKVTMIDANDLIQDGGAFHCVTFHLPDLDAIYKEKGHAASGPNSKS